jgi:hypothetical protein
VLFKKRVRVRVRVSSGHIWRINAAWMWALASRAMERCKLLCCKIIISIISIIIISKKNLLLLFTRSTRSGTSRLET